MVIKARQEVSGTRVSVVLGSSSTTVTSKGVEIPFKSIIPLPLSLGVGSYVLGGDFIMEGKTMNVTGKIKDVKSGLLLHVSSK